MKRHVFTILSALSLGLCICLAIAWSWSYVHPGWALWGYSVSEPEEVGRAIRVEQPTSWRARLEFEHYEPGTFIAYVQEYSLGGIHFERGMIHPPAFGHYTPEPGAAEGMPLRWELGIPLGYLIPLSLVLPACWFWTVLFARLRRWRRRQRVLCATCGYDLRASRDRCPECGTPTGTQPDSVTEESGGLTPAHKGRRR